MIENSRNSMSFEVFRRHQKKMLAVFAILAMFGFVVSDSLPRLLSSNATGRDQPVVKLYGKTLYQSDLNEMQAERGLANQFCSRLLRPVAVRRTQDPRPGRRPDPPARGRPAGDPGGPRGGQGVPQAGGHDRAALRRPDGRPEQPGQRRPGPRGDRQPVPAQLRPRHPELAEPADRLADGDALRHLPRLPRPEREGLRPSSWKCR